MGSGPQAAIQTALKLFRYDPANDGSHRLTFSEIAKAYPYVEDPEDRHTKVADFAEIGYCVYKGWHHGRASPESRTALSQAMLDEGTAVHEADRERIMEEAKKLKKATKRMIRDPFVNIHELPDFPGRIKVRSLTFGAAVDGTARGDGNLLIREMKKTRYFNAPDHKLQALTYCLTAPGGLVHFVDKDFAANEIWWKVHYPALGRDYGPYPFTQELREIVLAAMEVYEWLFVAGQGNDRALDGIPPISPAKCRPCSFRSACSWQTAS